MLLGNGYRMGNVLSEAHPVRRGAVHDQDAGGHVGLQVLHVRCARLPRYGAGCGKKDNCPFREGQGTDDSSPGRPGPTTRGRAASDCRCRITLQVNQDAMPRPTMLAAAMMTSMPAQSRRTGFE